MADKVSPATLGIDEAWGIINADPAELSSWQRAIRQNLCRRYREKRRPFEPEVLQRFHNDAMRIFLNEFQAGGNER